MKNLFLFLFLSFFSNIFSQNISPQFSELKGMEDQSSNTHLFYRIYSYTFDSLTGEFERYNNVFHFDLINSIDTLYLKDYSVTNVLIDTKIVEDFDIWNKNTDYFITCGGIGGDPDISAYIERFDGFSTFNSIGVANTVQISKQNDSLIFAGTSAYGFNGLDATIRSTDGGWNWEQISSLYQFKSLFPSNDDIYFAQDVMNIQLYKTTNSGISFYLVDSSLTYWEQQYNYDSDGNHIYKVSRNYFTNEYELKTSSNSGEAFSWAVKHTSPGKVFISINESITGEIYLADDKNIFLSTNYGDNFNLYKTLDRKIVGIYKKPNTNKLYAATKYKIYEITPDTIQVIKNLPIADEELKFYPLSIGNKWVYDTYGWWADTVYHSYSGITVREVIGDTVMPNGQFYYKLFDPTTFNYPAILCERIDSASGKVYRYDETLGLSNNEYLIEDLFAEVGDSIWSSRHQYQDYFPFICVDEGVFNKWGFHTPRKIFTIDDLTGYTYSLTQGVGVDSIYSSFDFGENFTTLKGCIIDGIVYGDTTVVSVEVDTPNLPTEFFLSQNYPNPFNPITTIKYQIPELSNVTLKVYDVLGNEIASPVNEEKPSGSYEVEFNATILSSGIYFYRLQAGSFVETKKMVLMK